MKRRKVHLSNYDSPITLKSRIQRLQEIQSSGAKEVTLDTFDIRFSGPDCGWLDSTVYVNGKEVFLWNSAMSMTPLKRLYIGCCP